MNCIGMKINFCSEGKNCQNCMDGLSRSKGWASGGLIHTTQLILGLPARVPDRIKFFLYNYAPFKIDAYMLTGVRTFSDFATVSALWTA